MPSTLNWTRQPTLTLKEIDRRRNAGASRPEAWQATMQLHLIVPEEKDEDEEPMPPNPAFDSTLWK